MSRIESEFGSPREAPAQDLVPARLDILLTQRKTVTMQLLALLARSINPDTGKIYTYEELGTIFHRAPAVIRRKLTESGVYRQPFPKVREGELPENQRAFFLGLALGNYSRKHVNWGRQNGFVVVTTESTKGRTRQLLKRTVGTWGEIRESSTNLRIYLNSPEFDFIVQPSVHARFLESRGRLAPFLLGALAAKLSDEEDRFSLDNENLLRRLHRQFSTQFGFSMGSLRVETRINQSRNGPVVEKYPLPVIRVANPGQVFGTLARVPSVGSLPFLADLARLSPASA